MNDRIGRRGFLGAMLGAAAALGLPGTRVSEAKVWTPAADGSDSVVKDGMLMPAPNTIVKTRMTTSGQWHMAVTDRPVEAHLTPVVQSTWTEGMGDDTDYLQAIIDRSGQHVDFPPGEYTISRPLVIPARPGRHINGNGAVIHVNGSAAALQVDSSHLDPLTFEEMQADCAARGCELKIHAPNDGWQLLTHYPDGVHTQANLEYRGGLGVVYERVDAWRRSLHEAEG